MPLSIIFADFRPIQLTPPIPQTDSIKHLSNIFQQTQGAQQASETDEESIRRIEKYAVGPSYIGQRELNAIPQESLQHPSHKSAAAKLTYLPKASEQPNGYGLDLRMELYQQVCQTAIEKAYTQECSLPDDLVHVSCSGYTAPSVAELFVARKGWPTTVTHSYHMGCYGAFPALRIAAGLLAASHACFSKPKQRVDLFHSEFLSLHLNTAQLSANNIINATLFGDGFIRYSAYTNDSFEEKKSGLKLLALLETLLPDSAGEMTWSPGPHQFDMFLSRYVPIHIHRHIKPFVEELCKQAGIDFKEEKEEIYFAIHPGGPGILNHIQKQLGIRDNQMDISWQVLQAHGNMSSVTVPYIWKEIIDCGRFSKGQKVVSMAFGPGLTASGSVMELV